MHSVDFSAFTQRCVEAVCSAGDAIDGFFGLTTNQLKTEWKFDETPLTIADSTSEEIIKNVLHSSYPELAIQSEESEMVGNPAGNYLCFVDPLDGTSSFQRGIPTYGISIALVDVSGGKADVVACVVHEPQTGRIWSAVKGQGAFLCKYNKHTKCSTEPSQIYVSNLEECPPEKSMLIMDASTKFRDVIPTVERKIDVIARTFPYYRRVRMIGSLALQFAYVASGYADATIADAVGGPHDLCPYLLVDEAGGRSSDVYKQPINIFDTKVAVATNGNRHDLLADTLQNIYS